MSGGNLHDLRRILGPKAWNVQARHSDVQETNPWRCVFNMSSCLVTPIVLLLQII